MLARQQPARPLLWHDFRSAMRSTMMPKQPYAVSVPAPPTYGVTSGSRQLQLVEYRLPSGRHREALDNRKKLSALGALDALGSARCS